MEESMRYLVYGREVCPTTGKIHYQGYVQFYDQLRITTVKEFFDDKVHLEISRGKPKEASDYCKKDGDFEEFGDMSYSGKRTDLESISRFVLEVGYKKATEECPEWVLKYPKGLEKLEMIRINAKRKNNWHGIRTITWIYGETGVGKSRWVRDLEPVLDTVKYVNNFYIGYQGSVAVLFDDFRPRNMSFEELLRITDVYDDTVNIKGGEMAWVPERIYFTSVHHPSWLYKDANEPIAQLMRRITRIIRVTKELGAVEENKELSNHDDYSN